MKAIILLIAGITLTFCLSAQRRLSFSLGPEVSLKTYSKLPSNAFGASGLLEVRLNRLFSFTADLGYNHFGGNVINIFENDTTRGFGVMPALVGLRIYTGRRFYLSGRVGLAAGVHNTATTLAVSPALGWMWPKRNKPIFDIGARYIAALPQVSYPENSFLNKGGYSYLNLRIAYVF